MKKSLLVKVMAPVVAVGMLTACSDAGASNGDVSGDALFDDGAVQEQTEAETVAETVAQTTLSESVETEEVVETVDIPEETEPIIGVIGSEAGSSVSAGFINSTGDDIVSLTIRAGSDGNFSENMLSDTFADGEQRVMFYDDSSDAAGSHYTVEIEFASGASDRLHRFEFDDADVYTIVRENNQTYLTYIGADGSQSSTLNNENLVDNPSGGSSSADSGCIGDDGLFY